jgi:hypothetical protein
VFLYSDYRIVLVWSSQPVCAPQIRRLTMATHAQVETISGLIHRPTSWVSTTSPSSDIPQQARQRAASPNGDCADGETADVHTHPTFDLHREESSAIYLSQQRWLANLTDCAAAHDEDDDANVNAATSNECAHGECGQQCSHVDDIGCDSEAVPIIELDLVAAMQASSDNVAGGEDGTALRRLPRPTCYGDLIPADEDEPAQLLSLPSLLLHRLARSASPCAYNEREPSLPSGWFRGRLPDGKRYVYHDATREVRWVAS